VPQQTFAAMKKAISQGTFFNRHVRDRFAFTHADNDDEALT
jgi:hypothetical protein